MRGAGRMPAARRAPDVVACRDLAFVVDQAAFEHPALFELDMFVVGEGRARRHAGEHGLQACGGVFHQNFDVDSRKTRGLPRQFVDLDVARRQRCQRGMLGRVTRGFNGHGAVSGLGHVKG